MNDETHVVRMYVDSQMNDFTLTQLTWKERLSSWPWRPWIKTELGPRAVMQLEGGSILVSPATASLIKSDPEFAEEVYKVLHGD